MIQLKEGDKAPRFTGIDQDGKKVSLTEWKGKKILIYFYPQDDTQTCTIQACNLRDHFELLKKEGMVVIGISPDDVQSHKKFETKYRLPFTMIADPRHLIIEKYGVWGEKQMFGNKYMGLLRTSFLVDEKGIIRKIFAKPKSSQHAEEVLKAAKDIK